MSEPPAPSPPVEPRLSVEVDEAFVDDVAALAAAEQQGMVLNLAAELRPADLAILLTHLPPEASERVFGWLPREQAGDVLPELEKAQRSDLLDELPAAEVAGLLDEIPSDDAADVLADLPSELAERVLPRLEDAAEVSALLVYPEDSAGGIMEAEFVAVPASATVADATEAVRDSAEDVDPVYVVYVTDEAACLQGFVPLKRLLLSPAQTPLTAIMEPDAVSVGPEVDQEEVARIMERYDLSVLPVVTAEGHLIGRITIDDVLDVIREEAEEDLQRASGITGEEELSASIFTISRGRLLWLMLGLVGAYVSGLVIVGFEEALQVAPILALFIPVVMAMAGNAGIQSSAIAVQGLASGDIWTSDVAKRLGKELAVALINGIALAFALGAIVLATGVGGDRGTTLALTAGLSLLIVIILATAIGATVPLMLSRVGIDPALAMGPFIMVTNDILGLTVFFVIATLLYL